MVNKLENINKELIANATFKLSLKHGFDNVSISQIEQESGVTTGGIYYHFDSKDDILKYILKSHFDMHISQYQKTVDLYVGGNYEDLTKFALYYMVGYDIKKKNHRKFSEALDIDFKEYYTFLIAIFHDHPNIRPLFYEFNEESIKYLIEIVKQMMEYGEIRKDLDPEDVAIYINSIYTGFTIFWARNPNISIEEVVESNINMMVEALKEP